MLHYFRFHHIGYAVKDISKASKLYLDAGWMMTDIVLDQTQNTYISFLTREGMPKIEFVAPVNDTSPIVMTLKKSGNSIYHICYAVDDINKAIQDLKHMHFVPLFKPVPSVAMDDKLICYLYNPLVGLIEVVEEK